MRGTRLIMLHLLQVFCGLHWCGCERGCYGYFGTRWENILNLMSHERGWCGDTPVFGCRLDGGMRFIEGEEEGERTTTVFGLDLSSLM